MKFVSATIITLILAGKLAMASENEQTVTFDVDKMTCATCPIAVRKAMQRVDGVKEVSVDFASNTATVTFDSTETTAAEIGSASADVGFPASAREGA